MKEIITACVVFGLAIVCFILGILSFGGKGFLLNNAYIYASKKEREKMDKKPYYKQSGVAFMLIGVTFVILGLDALLQTGWIWLLAISLGVAAVVYAIISSVIIEKRKKNRRERTHDEH